MTNNKRSRDLTVNDIVDYSISKISEYSEMCEDPTEMLVYFMAKKILNQTQLLEVFSVNLEKLTARLEKLLDK